MSHGGIAIRLRERGQELFSNPPVHLQFSQEVAAFSGGLRRYPHAFLFTCIFDRNVPTERSAWATLQLARRLSNFSFQALASLDLKTIKSAMTVPTALHRFPVKMALNIYEAIRLIERRYGGDAARIWNDRPVAAVLVGRLLEFRGIGTKIANMAAVILARDFHVEMKDLRGTDISHDVHIRRVLRRLGLLPAEASEQAVIDCGRALHPEFPGLVDLPLWEVGRTWCHPNRPNCGGCYLRSECPMAQGVRADAKELPRMDSRSSTSRREPGDGIGLQQMSGSARSIAERLIREVERIIPAVEVKPTKEYLALKYRGRLIASLYPRGASMTVGYYDAPRGVGWKTRFVATEDELGVLVPCLVERARNLR